MMLKTAWMCRALPLRALNSIKTPALIMAGNHDSIVTEHTVAIARNLPNSGHATLRKHADKFNRKLDEFFRHP